MTIYLCRHGRTHLNAEGRIRGHEDPPLDDVGEAQAAALGAHFAAVPIDAVLSTPLLRARETAAAIAAPHGLPVLPQPLLLDRDYGPWAGQPTDEVIDRFGSIDAAPGVESWDTFRDRVTAGFEAVLDTMQGTVVVVAHDAVNRAILQAIGGLDPQTTPQETGCWNQLEHSNGTWQIVAIDQRP